MSLGVGANVRIKREIMGNHVIGINFGVMGEMPGFGDCSPFERWLQYFWKVEACRLKLADGIIGARYEKNLKRVWGFEAGRLCPLDECERRNTAPLANFFEAKETQRGCCRAAL